MTGERVDLRCPGRSHALLGKIIVTDVNSNSAADADRVLFELACRDCTRQARQSDPLVELVVHRFDVAGRLVQSATTWVDPQPVG